MGSSNVLVFFCFQAAEFPSGLLFPFTILFSFCQSPIQAPNVVMQRSFVQNTCMDESLFCILALIYQDAFVLFSDLGWFSIYSTNLRSILDSIASPLLLIYLQCFFLIWLCLLQSDGPMTVEQEHERLRIRNGFIPFFLLRVVWNVHMLCLQIILRTWALCHLILFLAILCSWRRKCWEMRI